MKESEAEKKICPFLKGYCKTTDCMSWTKYQTPEIQSMVGYCILLKDKNKVEKVF